MSASQDIFGIVNKSSVPDAEVVFEGWTRSRGDEMISRGVIAA